MVQRNSSKIKTQHKETLTKLLKLITDHLDNDTGSIIIKYHVYYDNKEIGYFKLTEGYNFIDNMRVDEKFQHRGLATFMHDYIENDLGIEITPSEDLTDDGEEFYKFRSKKK